MGEGLSTPEASVILGQRAPLYPCEDVYKRQDLTRLGDALMRYYRQNAAMGAAQKDQADVLSRNVETQVMKLKNQTIPEMTERLSTIEYGIIMVISCLAMMFVAISGEGIASSIVTEKSSKITEYLLTSVRPLALIVGKDVYKRQA